MSLASSPQRTLRLQAAIKDTSKTGVASRDLQVGLRFRVLDCAVGYSTRCSFELQSCRCAGSGSVIMKVGVGLSVAWHADAGRMHTSNLEEPGGTLEAASVFLLCLVRPLCMFHDHQHHQPPHMLESHCARPGWYCSSFSQSSAWPFWDQEALRPEHWGAVR